MHLNLEPNVRDPDETYEALVAMHDGLTLEESFQLAARLILLLVNHIGDQAVVNEAIEAAMKSGGDRRAS